MRRILQRLGRHHDDINTRRSEAMMPIRIWTLAVADAIPEHYKLYSISSQHTTALTC